MSKTFLLFGFWGFFKPFLNLSTEYMEFREWGDIILCPTCNWMPVSTVHVGWNEAAMYFFFRSVRFWFGDSLLFPDAVLIFISLSVFPLQRWQQTCMDGIKWHTCPDLERKLLHTSWRVTEEQLLCWFGGGWMADNNQKKECHYLFCSPFYQGNNACTVQGFSFSHFLSIHFKPSI